MDRNTRKANFKKLQEAANNGNEPKQRVTSALSLSGYFDNEEAKKDPTNPSSREKVRNNQVFEPPGPRPKKAPKLSSKVASSRKGKTRTQSSRKQSSISDFLRNERIFSEVTAQHCLADNFSPDDIEMALALSKSEAEEGKLGLMNEVDDEVVNLLGEEKPGGSSETVRRKLQKYGFRTAAKEDYNPLAYAISLPVSRRGKRAKWANKFTPLTLRNPEVQQKKFESKVAALLKECDIRTKQVELMMPPYELISSQLKRLEPPIQLSIITESNEDRIELNSYYVKDLIEISYTPAQHLLKDWSAIQGRDLSPKRINTRSLKLLKQFETVYKELEKHYDNSRTNQMELDDLEQLVVENMVEDISQVIETEHISSTSSSPMKEPPDKRVRLSPEKKNLLPQTEIQLSSTSTLCLPKNNTRCISPDLFADSDEELYSETSKFRSISPKDYKIVGDQEKNSQMTTYEIYSSSSDEVKIVLEVTQQQIITTKEDVIDLTQGDSRSEKSCLSPKVFLNKSPTINSDSDVDNFNCTLTMIKAFQDPICLSDKEPSNKSTLQKALKTSSTSCSHLDMTVNSKPGENIYPNLTCKPESGKNKHLSSLQLDLESTPQKVNENNTDSLLELDLESSPLSFRYWNGINNSYELTSGVNNAKSSLQLSRSNSPLSFSHWNKSNNSLTDTFVKCNSAVQSFGSNVSINLTQQSDHDDGILLSDDEINYSIWKANKTMGRDLPENNSDDGSEGESFSQLPHSIKKSAIKHFQTAEELDTYLNSSKHLCSSTNERAEFGILEDKGISQPFNTSQDAVQNSQIDIDWSDGSFLESIGKHALKCNSSHKFQKFLSEKLNSIEDEFDEFDRMVFQDTKDSNMDEAMPSGLDKLLMGEINIETSPKSATPLNTDTTPSQLEQLEFNGKVYHISICSTPKPDFSNLPDSSILQRLYNYGIKPLKRKQAIKMLEFIYNQTHPIMQEELHKKVNNFSRSKSTPAASNMVVSPPRYSPHTFSRNELAKVVPTDTKFQDAFGSDLLRFSQTQAPSLCDDFEFYILQTNVTKKTPQPLIPFHIAWHNLLCANPKLYESLLMYEPIDLQDIYLHFKQMGHRYDPKDLKSFFDRRCIIFRYELPGTKSQTDRHIRKKPTKKQTKQF